MSKNDAPLEQRIKQFYKRQKLSEDILQELKALATADEVPPMPPPTTWATQVYRSGMYAMALILFLGLGLFGLDRYTRTQKLDDVAAEIALNHVKRFDTEFTSNNIANLSTEMDLLDFMPVHPQQLQYQSYSMIGARYCTIDSAIAVQIHLEDDDQRAYTLYQFTDPSLSLGSQETVIDIEDIQVTLWEENGVVMGLAEDLDHQSAVE